MRVLPKLREILRLFGGLCLCLSIGGGAIHARDVLAGAQNADPNQNLGPEQLALKQQTLQPALHSTQTGDAFVLQTNVNGGFVSGDVYALVPYPIAQLRELLGSPASWCAAAIFNINVKTCTHSRSQNGESIQLYVADQDYLPPEDAYAFDYIFRFQCSSPTYCYTQLVPVSAALDSRSYTFDIEALGSGDNATFLRLNYSSQIGFLTRSLLSAYLATLGRHKVGFTRTGTQSNGEPVYIDGIAGTFERNIMRYFFAFESYLAGLSQPAGERHAYGLNLWYDFTLKYRRQLYEVTREEYLETKRKEYANQTQIQQQMDHVADATPAPAARD